MDLWLPVSELLPCSLVDSGVVVGQFFVVFCVFFLLGSSVEDNSVVCNVLWSLIFKTAGMSGLWR
jgi:hypothetical protein